LSKLLDEEEEEESLPDLDFTNRMNGQISDEESDCSDDGKSEDETKIRNKKDLGVGSTNISVYEDDDEDDDKSENNAEELEDDSADGVASRGRGRGASRGKGRGFTKEKLQVVASLHNPVIKSPQVKRLRSGKLLFKNQ
jgi:hypothetical protein